MITYTNKELKDLVEKLNEAETFLYYAALGIKVCNSDQFRAFSDASNEAAALIENLINEDITIMED